MVEANDKDGCFPIEPVRGGCSLVRADRVGVKCGVLVEVGSNVIRVAPLTLSISVSIARFPSKHRGERSGAEPDEKLRSAIKRTVQKRMTAGSVSDVLDDEVWWSLDAKGTSRMRKSSAASATMAGPTIIEERRRTLSRLKRLHNV